MKQCTSDKALRYNSKVTTSFNEDEIEVADILLDLTNIITKSESNRLRGDDFPMGWGIRKRRSVPSSPHRVVEIQGTIKTPNKVRVESTSPLTPLSFYQSESDEKSKLTLKNNNTKKRTREEWLEIIDGLTRSRELLTREVDNERSRCNKLKSFNLALKAKKKEANYLCHRKEKVELGMDKRSLDIELKLDQNPMFAPQQQPQQLIINRVIYESQEASGGRFQYANHHRAQVAQFQPSNGGGGGGLSSGAVNHVGPLGIPDLNISCVEEEAFGLDYCQPLDQQTRVLVDGRVMCAAEARRRRMIKIKEMKKQQQRVR